MGAPIVWSSTAGQPQTRWLWSEKTDLVWIGGGGFFLFALIAVPLSFWPRSGPLLTTLFLHLGLVVNYPHLTMTYQVIFRERLAKPRAWRLLLVSTPIVAGTFLAGCFFPDLLFAPLLRLYLTWSAHHYAAQNFGLAALYCARAGRPLEARERVWLQGGFLGIGFFMMLMANTLGGDPGAAARVVGLQENGGTVPIAGFPSWMYYAGLGAVAASVGAFFVARARFRERTGKSFEPVVGLLFLTTCAWFVLPNLRMPGGASWMWPGLTVALLGAPPFFHCAQYLAVGGWRNRATGDVRPIVWFSLLVFSGYILFNGGGEVIPKILPIDHLRGILLLLGAVNLHHFFIDGLIWRRPKAAAAG